MNVNVYLHNSKENMWETGETLGLTGEALRLFIYACVEVKITLRVDEQTGEAKIIAVDGREVRD